MVQNMSALEKGNVTRLRRAELKAQLKRAEVQFADAIKDPAVENMRVFELLCFLPAHGPSRAKAPRSRAVGLARSLMRECGISDQTTFGTLNGRRTPLLLDAVHRRLKGLV
jgi:uncharacterized SAM-dependent methyltransferase